MESDPNSPLDTMMSVLIMTVVMVVGLVMPVFVTRRMAHPPDNCRNTRTQSERARFRIDGCRRSPDKQSAESQYASGQCRVFSSNDSEHRVSECVGWQCFQLVEQRT
jgi:hypothetical protein